MATAPVQPEFVRPDEAARMLGLGRTKLYEMLAAGEFGPVVKLGPRITLIPVEGVQAWKKRVLASAQAVQR